ncbi:MAG: small subunit ribosomal protein, partial [Thermoleophilaceae bacterium]|nr:small subunit ribosomal protein [Thermoleophilaceae bacterium]
MADEPTEQPPAEGDDAAAPEEVGPPAPEAQAEQETNEGEAPPEQPAAEEPAPAEAAEETAPPEPAEEPAPAEAAEESAPVEAEAAADEPAGEPAPEEPAIEEPAPAEAAAADDPAAAAAAEEPRRQRPPRPDEDEQQPAEETAVPGAHLEPDLVLDESRAAEAEFDPYATASDDTPVAEGEEAATVEDTTAPRTPLELAADARYRATGKRKRAIARVILKPGAGTYTINGKELDVYFPRVTLQKNAR